MNSRAALAQAVAILLEQEQADSTTLVDLAISIRVCDVVDRKYVDGGDEELVEVGGVWNRRTKRWEPGLSETLVVIRIPRGSEQEPAARYVAEWLRRAAIGPRGVHWDDFDRVWTLLLEGGRRGGKSYLSVVALVCFATMVPNALVWAVSPTNDETDELEGAIRSMLPGSWYTFRGGGGNRASQFKLPNGSRILLISGHKPRSLKRGRVDLVLYNEGQNMSRSGWVQLRGAIGDTGGLVIIAANPPDTEIGRWIEELHEKIRARMERRKRSDVSILESKKEKQFRGVLFKLTQATNPFVEHEALEDMASEVDDLTYRREVLGEFVPIGDIVMHAWSDAESVRDPEPRLIDVTARETKRELGRAAGYVVGMDFQKTPHMCATIYKLFTDPESEDPTEIVPWAVDEVVVEDANEDDLVNALEALPRYRHGAERNPDDCYHGKERGSYDPASRFNDSQVDHCAIVMDASGFWQDGEHSKTKHSDQRLRERGWIWLYPPQRESDKNPDVKDRCNTANARLKGADARDASGAIVKPGRRRMFVASNCLRVIRAMRSWPNNKLGFPDKGSIFSHVCDATTYPIHRFFARPNLKRTKGTYTPLERFKRSREL